MFEIWHEINLLWGKIILCFVDKNKVSLEKGQVVGALCALIIFSIRNGPITTQALLGGRVHPLGFIFHGSR